MAWGGEPKAGEIARVRKLDRWVDLSGAERPVAILCPERPAYRAAAKKIAEAIERLGGRRPSVSSDPEKTTPQTHTVIALGNVNNNRLIARLYFNGYAYEDSLLPGRGGWSLRTVYDPYPWHGRGDVIVVGVSDERDASQAAEALIRCVEKGKTKAGVGYLLEVSTAGKLTPSERRVLDSKRSPSFFTFLYSASRYLKTGQEAYARHAIETLERIVERYRRDPNSDCDWPEETNSGDILATWDAFEECPLLSDEQRLQYTRAFLRFMRSLRRHVSGYSRIGRGDLVTWNNTTFPLLGMYFGSRYFRDYYALPEADEYLAKARACFLAQARSWKPQEDADTYLIITMGHTVRYCLAEWQLEFFQSGRARQFGDYVISVCDSRGWLSGFGDSGIGRSSFLIRRAIPTLFWWYRDPGYLWVLEHVTEGKWRNPFHRDVKSRRPDRLVGLLVFPLDRQLYEYTRRRPFYGGPPAPPNVPPEAAFDKIAFRESWEKNAQYMLLDGFGRGKHLHFDTNAIIVLVDRGERWLIDHDYLTRNTTEHNMLSVIRDGRADRLVPSCAGLICQSDVGGRIGLVSTEVRDYCGVDWRRSIFWLKGGPLVVLDRMTARKPADYDLDLVWKVENRGDERLVDDHTFLARRLEVPWQTRLVTVVDDSSASGGKAAVLGQGGSVLAVAVDLPPGEYRLAVRAYGQDTGSDSLFAHTPDGTTVTVGTPRLKYGPNDLAGALRSAVPVKLTGTKRQLISLSLRERPPVRVDRLFFFDRRGRLQLAVEAEEAPQPTETDIATVPAKRFWIKWPDAPELTVKRGHPKGIVVPVCKLYQRMSRRLAAGESVELANVLYTDEASRPRRFSIERIGRGAVLLTGGEPALCAVRDANVDGLAFDAEMLFLSPTRIAWAGGRSLRFGALRLTSRTACNLEFDLTGKKLTARSPDGKPVQVQTSGVSGRAVRELLARLGKTVHAGGQGDASESKSAEAKRPARRASVQPAWSLKLPESGSVRRLKRADLDGDGRPELLVTAGNRACAVSADGRLLWSYSLAGTCYDIEAGELVADRPGLEGRRHVCTSARRPRQAAQQASNSRRGVESELRRPAVAGLHRRRARFGPRRHQRDSGRHAELRTAPLRCDVENARSHAASGLARQHRLPHRRCRRRRQAGDLRHGPLRPPTSLSTRWHQSGRLLHIDRRHAGRAGRPGRRRADRAGLRFVDRRPGRDQTASRPGRQPGRQNAVALRQLRLRRQPAARGRSGRRRETRSGRGLGQRLPVRARLGWKSQMARPRGHGYRRNGFPARCTGSIGIS